MICALAPFPICSSSPAALSLGVLVRRLPDQDRFQNLPLRPLRMVKSRNGVGYFVVYQVRLRIMSVEIGLGCAPWNAAREYERKPAALPVSAERGAGG
jgi:hypothetical protein